MHRNTTAAYTQLEGGGEGSVLMEEMKNYDNIIIPSGIPDKPVPKTVSDRIKNPFFATNILLIWMLLVVCIMNIVGLFKSTFFSFGPNDGLVFIELKIDTWTKWSMLFLYNIFDNLIWGWAKEIILPYMMNTVKDHKNTEIDVSKFKIFYMTNSYEVLEFVRFIINIWMMFSQIDLVISMFIGEIISTNITTSIYLKNKKFITPGKG